jgi:hypothetical protein
MILETGHFGLLGDEEGQEGRVCRMLTASTEYSLHARIASRQP